MSHKRRPFVPGRPPEPPARELEVLKEGNAKNYKPPVSAGASVWRPAPSAWYQSRTPLVPTAEEVAKLPRFARVAFAERCALRVRPIRAEGVIGAADAARVIFETATIDTPLTAQLRCVRHDFVRLKRLAREQKWTDETPVPPDMFGPMWSEGVEPHWAVEPPASPGV